MSEIETGGPAFPCMPPQDAGSGCATGYPYPDAGMTLRDYFAAKALQGMLACEMLCATEQEFSERAYKIADAMLKERNK